MCEPGSKHAYQEGSRAWPSGLQTEKGMRFFFFVFFFFFFSKNVEIQGENCLLFLNCSNGCPMTIILLSPSPTDQTLKMQPVSIYSDPFNRKEPLHPLGSWTTELPGPLAWMRWSGPPALTPYSCKQMGPSTKPGGRNQHPTQGSFTRQSLVPVLTR